MMSPTLVLDSDGPRLAVGSAGSNRIRSAVLQVISGVLDFGLSIEDAVEAARVHVEGDTVELEGGTPDDPAKQLTADGYQVNLWKEKNLFFGGAHAAIRTGSGFAGHGDSRRGGATVVI